MATGCFGHDHECGDAGCAGSSRLGFVVIERSHTLNTARGTPADILRPWDDRRRRENVTPVESEDDDPELIVHIAFSATVKLSGILVVSDDDGTAPKKMRAYINRDDGTCTNKEYKMNTYLHLLFLETFTR